MGQSRMGKNSEVFFTADEENTKILVSAQERILVFDDKGYYLGKSEETHKCIRSEHKQKILHESNQNN